MAEVKILKVSVLANDELLLGGRPVTLAELEAAIRDAGGSKRVVWYYRENAASEPSAFAASVLKLVADYKLPIRLSTRPDFSDTVTEVEQTVERVFAGIREKAAQKQLIVLRPDGRQAALPALDKMPPAAINAVEKILPASVKRNVAVLAETGWTMQEKINLQAANEAIPFFGLLMGFSCLGHAVWIFKGTAPAVLGAGCRDADVLIVDSAVRSSLPEAWIAIAQATMRNPQVLVHDRETHRLRKA